MYAGKKSHNNDNNKTDQRPTYLTEGQERVAKTTIKKAGKPVARNISQWRASCNGLKWRRAALQHTFQPSRSRAVFKRLSKVITRLRLLRLVIELKISHQFFHQ